MQNAPVQTGAPQGTNLPPDEDKRVTGKVVGLVKRILFYCYDQAARFTKTIRTGATSGLASLDGSDGLFISGGTSAGFVFGDRVAPNTAYGVWYRSGTSLILHSSDAGDLWTINVLTGQISQGAWTAPTLSAPWANFGLTHLAAGYRQDLFGRVWLRGFLKSGTANTTAFTLPSGMHPSGIHEFSGAYYNGASWVTYAGYVDTSGNVIPQQTPAAGGGIGIATCFDTLV